MRKLTALFVFAFLVCQVRAQITITASDMPSNGDIIHYSTTPDMWSIDPSLTGANYTWDFSFLTPQTQRSDTFVSVSATPFAYQFFFNNQIIYPDHHSDHAIPQATGGGPQGGGPVTISDVFNYFRVDNDAYVQTGFGSNINGVPSSTRYDPRDFIYRFPMTYGSTDGSLAEYLIVVPSLGAYGQTIDRSNEVDGWGTVTTPYGSFQALRLKTTIIYTDTFYIDQVGFGTSFVRPPATEYHWLAPNAGTPVLSITEVAQGPGPSGIFITYQDTLQPVAIPELAGDFRVYPNPARNAVYVQGNAGVEEMEVQLFDLKGQTMAVETAAENGRTRVERGPLPAGLYFLEIRANGKIQRQKVLFRD